MAEKDQWFRLMESGFPPDIVGQLQSGKGGRLTPELEEKFVKARELHMEVYDGAVQLGRVMLLLGPDSPLKDLFMAKMALHFIEHGFRPAYTTPELMRADWTMPPCYGLCVSGVSYINTKDWIAKKCGEAIRNHVAKGRVAILSAETMGDIETAFGGAFLNYISSFGVEIDFPSTRPEMPKL